MYSALSIYVLAAISAALEYYFPGVQSLRSLLPWSIVESRLNYFSDRSSFFIAIIVFGYILAPFVVLAFLVHFVRLISDIDRKGGTVLFKFESRYLIGPVLQIALCGFFISQVFLLDPNDPGADRIVSIVMSAFTFPIFVCVTAHVVAYTIMNILFLVALLVRRETHG